MNNTKIAEAILEVARVHDEGCKDIASALKQLGNGNAATHMGAIETLSCELKNGLESVSNSLSELGEGSRNGPLD